MEEALRSRLLEDEAVKAIVGTLVDWSRRSGGYPCIVLTALPSLMPQTYKGFMEMRSTRVQIDCLALDRKTVIALRKAAIAAVVPAGEFHGTKFRRSFIDSVTDKGSQTGTDFVERDKIDAIIWHN